MGYPRGYGSVRDYVSRTLRGKPEPIGPRPPSARAVTRWTLTHPDALTEHDRLHLKAVLAHCPELTTLAELPDQVRGPPRPSPAGPQVLPSPTGRLIHTRVDRSRPKSASAFNTERSPGVSCPTFNSRKPRRR